MAFTARLSKPSLTAEQWAENDRRVEEERRKEEAKRTFERIKRSGIPDGYRGASLRQCTKAVRDWYGTKGLLLQGDFGTGKTYSACAVLIANVGSMTVRFDSLGSLLGECKAAFDRGESEEGVISRRCNCGLLCIDDLGKEKLTDWSLPILFRVIDTRGANNRPTIVTTNCDANGLIAKFTANGGDITTAKAIISRLAEYDRVVLAGRDRRLK